MDIPDLNTSNTRILSEKYIQKHNTEFYSFINDKYQSIPGLSWNEKVYMYKTNMDEPYRCPVCGKYARFINKSIGYAKHCSSKCNNSDPNKLQMQRNTMMNRYGVVSPSQLEDYSVKVKKTKLEKYGDENYNNREKFKKTNLERYGDEKYTNIEKMRQTKLERYGDEYYTNREKSKQTTIEHYGVECPFSDSSVREKSMNTKKSHEFTDSYYLKLNTIINSIYVHYNYTLLGLHYNNIDQIKQTNIQRYGYASALSNHVISLKKIDTYRKNRILNTDNLIGYDENGYCMYKCPHNECIECAYKQFISPRSIYYDRIRLGIEPCTILNPIKSLSGTSPEIFVRNILDEYQIEYQTNVRNIISPKELDIYIPSKQIAIECNGVFYHSTQMCRSYRQHEDKWMVCKCKGIQLLTIWEDWIKNKPEIVKSIILNKLGLCSNTIPARKCTIQEISSKECIDFLNGNHIQGSCRTGIRLALMYDNHIVSVMTFNKKRGMMGNNKLSSDNEYELSRFCNILNTRVIGAASKLLKYFKTHYDWDAIYSFSSNDISDGGLYDTLGFNHAGGINHCYWYIDKSMNRHHRTEYSKDNIVRKCIRQNKDGWTESDVTKELGLLKIYDSGQQKWILKKDLR